MYICLNSRSNLLIFAADIRELISLDDVMEELGLGPNGGLMYCMEYPSLKNLSFFESQFY